MRIVPSITQLKKGMLARNEKENLIYKIVIDIYGTYLKEYDGPTYKVSQNSTIYYKKLSTTDLYRTTEINFYQWQFHFMRACLLVNLRK